MPKNDLGTSLLTTKLPPEEAAELEAAFTKLCLPIPNREQCLKRSHGNYLLPVTNAGVTLHIRRSPLVVIPHDRVLQPLGEMQRGPWHISIIPGVALNCNDTQCAQLREKLKKDHVNFSDEGVRNLGNLPIKTPEYPEGIPVVIDPDAVTPLPGFVPQGAPVQDCLYQPLRQLLATALAQPKSETMQKSMRQFWKECTHLRMQNTAPLLIPGWQNVQKNYGEDPTSRMVKTIASEYAGEVSLYWRQFDREQLGIPSGKGHIHL